MEAHTYDHGGQGMETVMPGDHATMKVTLVQPMAMDEDLKFTIPEGGGRCR